MIETIDNVTCAACGLICENLTLRVDDGQITSVEGACTLCKAQLLGFVLDDKQNSSGDALSRATEILSESRAPLICGLANSTVETQRAAVALADHLGATLDPAISTLHRNSIVAMQSVGISTCTLGEVKQRADVVLFWGADPQTSHPRLYERFIDPPGTFVSQDRHIIGIGSKQNKNRVDEVFQIDPSETLAIFAALRAVISGIEIAQASIGGICLQQLQSLANRLQHASYSVVFFGPEIGGSAEIEALFMLVRQLNTKSRSAAIGLGNILCENVLTWQTGYPCGVNFALGYPRYDPYAYSANTLLEHGEVDAVLMIGSENLDGLSPAAMSHLAKLPLILLENADSTSSLAPTVRITTARPGVHCGGTVFRMDGVSIKLHAIFDSSLPTAASVLTTIQAGVSSSCV